MPSAPFLLVPPRFSPEQRQRKRKQHSTCPRKDWARDLAQNPKSNKAPGSYSAWVLGFLAIMLLCQLRIPEVLLWVPGHFPFRTLQKVSGAEAPGCALAGVAPLSLGACLSLLLEWQSLFQRQPLGLHRLNSSHWTSENSRALALGGLGVGTTVPCLCQALWNGMMGPHHKVLTVFSQQLSCISVFTATASANYSAQIFAE